MLHFETDRLFRDLTTFKIGGPAHIFAEITDPGDLPQALDYVEAHGLDVLILGGGSNMLVSDSGYGGAVLRIANRGIERVREDDTTATLRVGSGEIWDDVVAYSVREHLWGIENLSRIPGRSGAFAVQNVGAYGPEACDVIESVETYDRKEHRFRTLTAKECHFRYRKSIFNTTEKNRFVILATNIRLSKEPKRNLSYPDVRKRFENDPEPSQEEIRHAIKEIRDTKFPFPAESIEGNAGSFFKNAILTEAEYESLEAHFRKHLPEHLERLQQIRHRFPTNEGIKIPGAFIFDACGLKGYRKGNVMLNPTQPVILLNATGNATADEVLDLVREVRGIVHDKTGLHLYTEPELIGFTESELRNAGFNDAEIARYIYNAVEE